MVTLNDIAKMANVSKSTVSRYLNQGSVSQKTKEKLDKIVKETGYQPNFLAQSLKPTRSNMAGVIIPRYDSPSTNTAMKGIDSVAYAENVQLMITNANLNLERTKQNMRLLQRQKVGAIILFATEIDQELEDMIRHRRFLFCCSGKNWMTTLPSFSMITKPDASSASTPSTKGTASFYLSECPKPTMLLVSFGKWDLAMSSKRLGQR